MSTRTDKIRERLEDAKDRIDNMLTSVDSGIHENDLHDTESDIDEAIAALSELEAQPSGPRLTVDQAMEIILEEACASPGGPLDLSIRERLTKAAQ